MRFTTTTNILLATALVQGAALPPGGDQRFPQPGSNGLTNAPGGFRPGGNNDDFGLSSFGQGGRGGGGGGFDDFDDDDLFDDRKIRVRNSLKQRLDHDDDDFDDDDTPAERARERQDDLRDAQEDRLERERERQGRPPVKRAIRVRGSLKKRDNDDDNEDDSPAERAREREDDARERADDRLDDLRDAQDDQLERERERQWRQGQGRRQGGRGAPVRKRFDVSDALGDAGDGAEDAFQDGLREVGGLFGGRKMRRGDDGVDDFDDDVDDFQRGGGAGRFGAPQGLGQGRGFGPQGLGQGGRRQGGRGGFDDFDDDQFDDRKKN
ncbi:hypothetical protein NpNSSI1_00006347 [Neofusicoccum parvum]|nr:hypothetical protein NpNSSI1_00006347 [Neofusicoccum parvum]